MSTVTEELHSKLLKVNKQLEWPAIYRSRELLREVKRERREIVAKLRDLPLAS